MAKNVLWNNNYLRPLIALDHGLINQWDLDVQRRGLAPFRQRWRFWQCFSQGFGCRGCCAAFRRHHRPHVAPTWFIEQHHDDNNRSCDDKKSSRSDILRIKLIRMILTIHSANEHAAKRFKFLIQVSYHFSSHPWSHPLNVGWPKNIGFWIGL